MPATGSVSSSESVITMRSVRAAGPISPREGRSSPRSTTGIAHDHVRPDSEHLVLDALVGLSRADHRAAETPSRWNHRTGRGNGLIWAIRHHGR